MSTELDLDIAELVGELPAQGCEDEQHDGSPFHEDGAEHYVRFMKPCGHDDRVQVLCMKAMQTILSFDTVHCCLPGCDWSLPPAQVMLDLGPANNG